VAHPFTVSLTSSFDDEFDDDELSAASACNSWKDAVMAVACPFLTGFGLASTFANSKLNLG